MKPKRALGMPVAIGVLLAAATALLLWGTEWVELQTPVRLSDALAQDGSFAAREMLSRLGMKPRRADELTTLPPPGATLVVATGHWNLVGDSSARLQRWVEAGGHLVVDASVVGNAGAKSWLPLGFAAPGTDEPDRRAGCRVLSQRRDLAAAWGETRGFVACIPAWRSLTSPLAPSWALDSEEQRAEALRVPFGSGRVSAFAGNFAFEFQAARPVPAAADPVLRNFSNRGLLEGDNAALLAALVDAEAGREVWFVTRVDRPALPLWLWQHAAPALLLAAVALLFAIWRGALRFGPVAAVAPLARRSLAEQVRGLADFLFRHQPAALHAAALRALHEAASQRLPAPSRRAGAAQTAEIAHRTGFAEARLAAALDGAAKRSAAGWSEDLALLETARRRLIESNPKTVRTR